MLIKNKIIQLKCINILIRLEDILEDKVKRKGKLNNEIDNFQENQGNSVSSYELFKRSGSGDEACGKWRIYFTFKSGP